MSSDTIIDQAKIDISVRLDKVKADIKAIPIPTPAPVPTNIYDDFNYNFAFTTQGQISPNGKWTWIYQSGGFAKMDSNGMVIAPAGPVLRSSLVRSTQQWGNCVVDVDITTEKQVVSQNADGTPRTPSQWMCAWFLFRDLDKWRHYYLYVGLDHIEFGKKDAPTNLTNTADIEKYQKILWGGGPKTPLGTKRHITVEMVGDNFKIFCDGVKLMDMNDVSSFKSGSVSPYAEGSQARYQTLKVTPK